ncbi:hypothetical protein O181_090275 [Austropuccinia psidii MF-1]|uniref:Uncharacterized protein n=1 Tax=Austropuccinia psidii MF-1 TaxID=1389203 RepID=A0A9Q3IUS1_9BASI|nr:hypothetical protein [Austropuccinia psidii MF-1]
MTPTRSGSNNYIQSNGSGPRHSSHNSKGQDCQPRGEAQMEYSRASTSSQRLASTFDTLLDSREADITAIPAVRPEAFSTGINRNIPVSVQEFVYGGKEAGVGASSKSLDGHNELISSIEEVQGPRKDKVSSEGLDTHVLQRTSPTDKSWVEKPKHVVRGPEEKVGPRKGQQPSGSKSSKQGKANPKEQSERKGKAQVEQALPTELQNSQEREESHGQCIQYGKKSDGIQKQGGGKNEPILSKEIDLVNHVNYFEACNKEILAKLKNSEYIQQMLGGDTLQIKESQKTIIGVESVIKTISFL